MLALFLLRVADKLSSRSGALPLFWGGRAPGIPRASHPQLGKHTEEDYYRPECAVPVLWIGSSHCFMDCTPYNLGGLRFLARGPLVLLGRDCLVHEREAGGPASTELPTKATRIGHGLH